jgi:thymidylate synthase (FAD)
MDPYFRVETIAATPRPNRVIYVAMHQDYCEDFAIDDVPQLSDEEFGDIIVKRLLKGERGHYGCLEHVQIALNCGWFPHSVMQQARTHRTGISFDVQSGRYTGKRVVQVVEGTRDVEEVFYLRPVGTYTDRNGAKYEYTEDKRKIDRIMCIDSAGRYMLSLREGLSEEHARDQLPYCLRQHFVVSFNLRSALHFMDLRAKLDAQLEIRQMCELVWPHIVEWAPEVAAWYEKARMHKARLAP